MEAIYIAQHPSWITIKISKAGLKGERIKKKNWRAVVEYCVERNRVLLVILCIRELVQYARAYFFVCVCMCEDEKI